MGTDKKEHIIDIAVELFAEKGFEGTSIRDIAAKADVNLAMINYYFGSKENLFGCMVKNKAAYTTNILDGIVKDDALSEKQKIDQVIDVYINKFFANRAFHRVIHQELMLSQRETLQQAIVDVIFPNSLIVKSIIEKGIRKGVFKKVDIPLTIATLVGSINQVLLSKTLCNRLLEREKGYVPYEDEKFRKRFSDHIKQVMHAHLLK